ncbi:hypothetical protein CEXT_566931 [Caerostris extrusa]|uniref:Uncharacterized protein n=1 Tax=Caerostris extrusa TaxID=172846 RepID=A0AAV4SJY6_CAEEX|nr:hypothetical protein CEXT_566931 [Caerostris extrusa]
MCFHAQSSGSLHEICSLCRDRFLKLTVNSEIEHLKFKSKLVQLGLDFKCFNLKQDRPIKVLIRGLPSCTSKEAINSAIAALGYKVLAVNQRHTSTTSQLRNFTESPTYSAPELV